MEATFRRRRTEGGRKVRFNVRFFIPCKFYITEAIRRIRGVSWMTADSNPRMLLNLPPHAMIMTILQITLLYLLFGGHIALSILSSMPQVKQHSPYPIVSSSHITTSSPTLIPKPKNISSVDAVLIPVFTLTPPKLLSLTSQCSTSKTGKITKKWQCLLCLKGWLLQIDNQRRMPSKLDNLHLPAHCDYGHPPTGGNLYDGTWHNFWDYMTCPRRRNV